MPEPIFSTRARLLALHRANQVPPVDTSLTDDRLNWLIGEARSRGIDLADMLALYRGPAHAVVEARYLRERSATACLPDRG